MSLFLAASDFAGTPNRGVESALRDIRLQVATAEIQVADAEEKLLECDDDIDRYQVLIDRDTETETAEEYRQRAEMNTILQATRKDLRKNLVTQVETAKLELTILNATANSLAFPNPPATFHPPPDPRSPPAEDGTITKAETP